MLTRWQRGSESSSRTLVVATMATFTALLPGLRLLLLTACCLTISGVAHPAEVPVSSHIGRGTPEEPRVVDPYCGAPDGLFPHEWDCRLFFSCSNGRGCLLECPLGTKFHRGLRICVWPKQASCTSKFGPVPSSWPPLQKCSELQNGPPPTHPTTTPAQLPTLSPMLPPLRPLTQPPSLPPFPSPITPPTSPTDSVHPLPCPCAQPGGQHPPQPLPTHPQPTEQNLPQPSTQSPQPSRPQHPQPSIPQTPQPSRPQPLKPSRPQTPQPSTPQPPQPSRPQTPQPSRPQLPQPSRPQTLQPSRPQTPQPSRPQTPQPSRPQRPQPSQPQPIKPYPSQPQPSKPHPTQPQPSKPYPSQPKPLPSQPLKPYPIQPHPSQPYPSQPHPHPSLPTHPSVDTVEECAPFCCCECAHDQDSKESEENKDNEDINGNDDRVMLRGHETLPYRLTSHYGDSSSENYARDRLPVVVVVGDHRISNMDWLRRLLQEVEK